MKILGTDPKDKHEFNVCSDSMMECPACNGTYTHLESIGTDFASKDNRLCARLNFWCEQGHKFTVRVQQHKGFTYFEISENVIYQDWDGENWIDPPR
jgi:hypothetical protein